MKRARLILLNGFAAAGKSTIAKRYIDDHPLAFIIEGDELITNIGSWLKYESEARLLVYETTKAMLRAYLPSGHDVILPYLVVDASHVAEFEKIADELGADFHEIVLHSERRDAIAKLLKRGVWGEFDSPPITDKDMPDIEKLMDDMESAMEKRPSATVIPLKDVSVDDTYEQFLKIIE